MRVSFGPWTLDTGARELSRGSERAHLSTKAFDLLALLVSRTPDVVTKEEITAALWPRTHVVEGNIANLVAEIRAALRDAARAPRFLRTAHGVGYSFSNGFAVDRPAGPNRRFPLLAWLGREFPLKHGSHVVGRGALADVKIDESTVSRFHARLIVDDSEVYVEDLGSRHGTLLETKEGRTRISGLTLLPSPARLILGGASLRFEWAEDATTDDVRAEAGLACEFEEQETDGRPDDESAA
jgi:DNA-binding winged helix-turn-helix (wHTH) protein